MSAGLEDHTARIDDLGRARAEMRRQTDPDLIQRLDAAVHEARQRLADGRAAGEQLRFQEASLRDKQRLFDNTVASLEGQRRVRHQLEAARKDVSDMRLESAALDAKLADVERQLTDLRTMSNGLSTKRQTLAQEVARLAEQKQHDLLVRQHHRVQDRLTGAIEAVEAAKRLMVQAERIAIQDRDIKELEDADRSIQALEARISAASALVQITPGPDLEHVSVNQPHTLRP